MIKRQQEEKNRTRVKKPPTALGFLEALGGLGRGALADKLHKRAKLPQLWPCTPYQGNDT